jgi:homoserine kinase
MKVKYTYSRVFAPATVANVGPGFDIFGLALEQPGDEVEVMVRNTPGLDIIEITGDQGILPADVTNNTATVAINSFMQDVDLNFGFDIKLHKKMPVGSGLGSSAASAVAGVVAVNSIFERPHSREALLKYVVEGERITSGGSVHLDNVAACLYGGFILVRSKDPADIISVPVKKELVCTVIHPRIEIKTSESRKMLKRETSIETAVMQWGNIAGMVSAFYRNDMDLLGRSLQDVIAEPVRSILIPHFNEMKKLSMQCGAIGFGISGSGPSVFALCASKTVAGKIAHKTGKMLTQNGVGNDVYISLVNRQGPRLLERR